MSPRVVLDTNIIVSAALDTKKHLIPYGRPSLCLALAFSGSIKLVASESLLAEYEEVLLRPRFRLPRRLIREFCESIRGRAALATPSPIPSGVVLDPDDAHVLGAAIAGRARFLVTGDLRHFPKQYRQTRIVTPQELIFAVVGGVASLEIPGKVKKPE